MSENVIKPVIVHENDLRALFESAQEQSVRLRLIQAHISALCQDNRCIGTIPGRGSHDAGLLKKLKNDRRDRFVALQSIVNEIDTYIMGE